MAAPDSAASSTPKKTAKKPSKKAPGGDAPKAISNLDAEHLALAGAYMEERDALVEVARKALDFMTLAEQYHGAHVEKGERGVETMIAQGKLFVGIHDMHKSHLKRRVIEVLDKLKSTEHRYMHVMTKSQA